MVRLRGLSVLAAAAALALVPATGASAAVKLVFDIDVTQVYIRDHNYVNFSESFFDERIAPYSVTFRQSIMIDDLAYETRNVIDTYREYTHRQVANSFQLGATSPELDAMIAFTGDDFTFKTFSSRVSDSIKGGVAMDFADKYARFMYSEQYIYGYQDLEINVGEERMWTLTLTHQEQTLIDLYDPGTVGTPDELIDDLVGAPGRFNFDLRARAIAYDYDYRLVDETGNPKQNFDRGMVRSYQGTATLVSVERTGAVPEPGAWALLIAGFGLTGAALRARGRRERSSA